jgi:3-dehydroquinate synthase
MNSITVKAEISYAVNIGCNWDTVVDEILRNHQKVLFIAPKGISNLIDLSAFLKDGEAELYFVPDGELQKNISIVQEIWTYLGENDFGRGSAIVGIGGGATTDLAGFVASTWLRGIAWYAIPTTLAGMVDASIGGKTGINVEQGKNLVGSFYSPRSVEIDVGFLDSLSDRDFSAGLAEIIKSGFIRDISILVLLENHLDVPSARSIVTELITKTAQVKADVVSQDFTESRLREILNYGHTFGHAIEKLSQYQLRHGEAVSIGLHFASLLSEDLLGLQESNTKRLLDLLNAYGLPSTFPKEKYPWPDLLRLMMSDKKTRDGSLRFIGLEDVAKVQWLKAVNPDQLQKIYGKIAR